MADNWASGTAYEQYMARWSRLVADEFVPWLDPQRGSRILDVGCGTGALTSRLAARGVATGVDPSEAFLAYAGEHVSTASFEVGDAMDLPFPDDAFDVAASGLVLNFVSDQDRMLHEIRRVVRPGGVVGVYVWDYSDGMELLHRFWEAATYVDPAAARLDESIRFPVCRPGALEAAVRRCGFARIEARDIVVPTTFADFDDYWTPFLGGQGPAPTYLASLDETRRDQVRDRLREILPSAEDDSIRLTARAWAVRATA